MSITKILCERSSGHPSFPSSTRNYSCYACLEKQLCNNMKALKCSLFQFISCIENISSQKDLGDVCPIKCYPSKLRWSHFWCCIPPEPAGRRPTPCGILLLALEPSASWQDTHIAPASYGHMELLIPAPTWECIKAIELKTQLPRKWVE